jgi:hypothetical protein
MAQKSEPLQQMSNPHVAESYLHEFKSSTFACKCQRNKNSQVQQNMQLAPIPSMPLPNNESKTDPDLLQRNGECQFS